MRNYLVIISLLFALTSCWPTSVSFRDGTLPEEWQEFYVVTLDNNTPNAPLNYPVDLSEDLKDGVQNNTRLGLAKNEDDSQLVISGIISNFSIQPIALQEGDEAASNRLTIQVKFTTLEKVPEEKENTFTISRFADYNSDDDYSSIENQLLEEINKQIVQDVINKLLANW